MSLFDTAKKIAEGIDSLDAALNLRDRAMGKKDAPQGQSSPEAKARDEKKEIKDLVWQRTIFLILTNQTEYPNCFRILTAVAPVGASDEEKQKIEKRKEGVRRLLTNAGYGLIKSSKESKKEKKRQKKAERDNNPAITSRYL